jgi:hypothetical protein
MSRSIAARSRLRPWHCAVPGGQADLRARARVRPATKTASSSSRPTRTRWACRQSARQAIDGGARRPRPLSRFERFRAEGGAGRRYDVPARMDHAGQRLQRHPRTGRACAGVSPASRSSTRSTRFAVYALATQEVGARAIVVPARDYGHDLDAMAAAIAPDTRLVFIANPNNPDRHLPAAPAIEAFLAGCRPTVVVVLDEAYNEYLRPGAPFRLHRLGQAPPEPAGVAHVLQGLRPGRTAGRIRPGPARAHRSAQPGAPAVQRQFAGAGGGDRCPVRPSLPRAQLRGQPARAGAAAG